MSNQFTLREMVLLYAVINGRDVDWKKFDEIMKYLSTYHLAAEQKKEKMSTKSTLLLTKDNEHWYKESNARYYEEAKTESAIVLEFDPQHKFEQDSDGLRVVIEEGTELYKALSKARFPTYGQGETK